MDTENARVTRAQAAALAGVTERTISRWSAAGDIGRPERPRGKGRWSRPVTWDRAAVLDRARRRETDTSG